MDQEPNRLHEHMRRRFDEIAGDPKLLAEFRTAIGDPLAPSRVRAAQDLRGCRTILDVGCGLGTFHETLCAHPPADGWSYTGVDSSPAMVRAARAVGLEARRVTIERDAVAQLTRDDGTGYLAELAPHGWDGALVRHVLEHMLDPRAALATILDLARLRVVLVFSQWPTDGPLRILTDSHMGVPRWSHPRHVLDQVIERAGWTVRVRDLHNPRCETLSPREGYWVLSRKPATE